MTNDAPPFRISAARLYATVSDNDQPVAQVAFIAEDATVLLEIPAPVVLDLLVAFSQFTRQLRG